jgi:uncharacterized protein YbgA (DUF1722 family)/uncharacterized protein YbbK (DUF523 family)
VNTQSVWQLEENEKIPVGISSCLVGNPVRYNGGHKHDRRITDTLGQFFEFTAVCPEVSAGLGVPRPTIRLVENETGVTIRGAKKPELDVTHQLVDASAKIVSRLPELAGFILKKDSPSCGVFRVKIYREDGHPSRSETRGEFTHKLLAARPWLPVEEEGRLNDPVLRENFINRVIVYRRLQKLETAGNGIADLIDFHSCHKLLLQSHSPEAAHRLGRLLATPGDLSFTDLVRKYRRQSMTAMRKTVPRRRHAMVMERLAGYLRDYLDAGDRHEFHELVGSYRRGEMPLVVPITMLRHHLRRLPENHAARQVYLSPHPDALALRNAI